VENLSLCEQGIGLDTNIVRRLYIRFVPLSVNLPQRILPQHPRYPERNAASPRLVSERSNSLI